MTKNHRLAIEGAATLVFLLTVLLSFARFVARVEHRPGVVLADPLLARFAPRDSTWLIFIALYGAILLTIGLLVRRPRRLLAGCQAYALMVLLRLVMMWAAPFEPPPTMIALADPFVGLFGPPAVMTRDLFFSGHTATCTMLALAAPTTRWRVFLALLATLVACGVLAQHVHYFIDVLVAPLAALFAWRATLAVRARLQLPPLEEG